MFGSLVELLELLRVGGLEWSGPCETLEENGSDTPQVCLAVILLRHDDFWSLIEDKQHTGDH